MESKDIIRSIQEHYSSDQQNEAISASQDAYEDANRYQEPFTSDIPRYAALMDKAVEEESEEMLMQALYLMVTDYYIDLEARKRRIAYEEANPPKIRQIIFDIPSSGFEFDLWKIPTEGENLSFSLPTPPSP